MSKKKRPARKHPAKKQPAKARPAKAPPAEASPAEQPPRRATADEFTRIGIPASTLDAWLRRGILGPTSARGVYLLTDATDDHLAAWLRQHPAPAAARRPKRRARQS